MAEPKTKQTKASVKAFLDGAAKGERRKDCDTVLKLMKAATRAEPKMWGASIVGFGAYEYTNTVGTAEWPIIAFSPRKDSLTLYLMPGFEGQAELMTRLGKHKVGKSCLYLKSLADVDAQVLKELVTRSVAAMKARYKTRAR